MDSDFYIETSIKTSNDLRDYYNLEWLEPHLKEYHICLAGGALLSFLNKVPAEDLDLYLPNPSLAGVLAAKIVERGFRVKYKTTNAITYEPLLPNPLVLNYSAIQLIINPEFKTDGTLGGSIKLLEHFDFRVCMIAYSFFTGQFLSHNLINQDLRNKVLMFNPLCIGKDAIPWRLIKYLKKGYSISYSNFLLMHLTFLQYQYSQKVDSDSYKKLEERRLLMMKLKDKIKELGTIEDSDPNFKISFEDLYKTVS